MDREELSQAVWVNRSDVPEMKDNHSLTGHMIEMFRTGREYYKNYKTIQDPTKHYKNIMI